MAEAQGEHVELFPSENFQSERESKQGVRPWAHPLLPSYLWTKLLGRRGRGLLSRMPADRNREAE